MLLGHLNLLSSKGFEVRKKSLDRHFHWKITSRSGSKHSLCLINNITNIFVVLELIVLQNDNNLLKMNYRFGADLYGKVLPVVWTLLPLLA